jgi:hypothetical protein
MRQAFQDRKSAIAAAVAGAVWVLFTIAYVTAPLGEQGRPWIADLVTLASAWTHLALSPVATCARRQRIGSTAGRPVLWSVGETLWAYYDLSPGLRRPSSIADLAQWAISPLWVAFTALRSIYVRGFGAGQR